MGTFNTLFEYCRKAGTETKQAAQDVGHGFKKTAQETKGAFKEMGRNVKKATNETKGSFKDIGQDLKESNDTTRESFKKLEIEEINKDAMYVIPQDTYNKVKSEEENAKRLNKQLDLKIQRFIKHIKIENDKNGHNKYLIQGKYVI